MKHQNKLIFIIYYILLYSILFVTIILSISCAEKKEKKVVETDTTAPSAPDNLTAYATTDVINLYWDKNQETDIEKYRVYRSNSTIPTLPAKKTSQLYNTNFSNNGYVEETGTSYADTDISFGVTYYYRVSALDKSSNESNKSNQVQVTYGDHTPPAKPALLTALPGTRQGEVSLAWALNTEPDLLSYNIYISDSGGITYNFLASSKSNSYTVKDLSPDTEYYFYITALDTSKNESLSSNLVVSKPYGDITPPLKPALLTALPGTRQGEVSLAWTLNIESDLMSYNIYKSDSSGGIRTYLGTSTTNSYTVKGLILDVDYYFYITAVDKSNNESEPSNLAVSKPYGDITPPLKPTGLLASPGSKKGEIDLSWTANTEEDFLSYGIYFAIQGGTDFVFIESSLLNSYIARDLKPGYGYYFRITAVDKSNNESEYSDTVFSLAKGDKVAPLAPAGLTASAGGSKGKINLSWKANTESDLEKYRIYQSANGSVYGEIDNVKGTPPDTTYIVSGLTTGTYYFYKISAIDDSGNESERSNRTGADAP